MTVEDELTARRDHFRKLLLEAGISPGRSVAELKKFAKIIETAFTRFTSETVNCNSYEIAKLIFEKAKAIFGTNTRLKLMESESSADQIILDGLVPGAYSNKAVLQYVLVNGVVYVFKYPTAPDFAESIRKDFQFCNALKDRNGGNLPSGIVEYRKLTITNSANETIDGSISKVYCMALSSLSIPLPPAYIASIGNRLIKIVEEVHSLGYVINDIKPDNIFLGQDGSIDIGDFGGATTIGDTLNEVTVDYYPQDLRDSRHAQRTGDWMCLVNTIFTLASLPRGSLCNDVRRLIADYNTNDEIKALLNTISNKFAK
jgi:serine/threonine protein kinase